MIKNSNDPKTLSASPARIYLFDDFRPRGELKFIRVHCRKNKFWLIHYNVNSKYVIDASNNFKELGENIFHYVLFFYETIPFPLKVYSY